MGIIYFSNNTMLYINFEAARETRAIFLHVSNQLSTSVMVV